MVERLFRVSEVLGPNPPSYSFFVIVIVYSIKSRDTNFVCILFCDLTIKKREDSAKELSDRLKCSSVKTVHEPDNSDNKHFV